MDAWRTGLVVAVIAASVALALVVAVGALQSNHDRSLENAIIIDRLERQQAQIKRQQVRLTGAVRRLQRLEHPTKLDLQRLFRGLLVAATPGDVRRLVRRLRDLGVVLPRRGVGVDGGKPPG